MSHAAALVEMAREGHRTDYESALVLAESMLVLLARMEAIEQHGISHGLLRLGPDAVKKMRTAS